MPHVGGVATILDATALALLLAQVQVASRGIRWACVLCAHRLPVSRPQSHRHLWWSSLHRQLVDLWTRVLQTGSVCRFQLEAPIPRLQFCL